MTIVNCARCGKEGEAMMIPTGLLPPKDWEGTWDDAVCPNCQLVAWHPHCTGLIDHDGERVDPSVIPPDEWANLVARCDHIDLTVSWVDQADYPQAWQCSECGGTGFEGVHADYGQSGLRGFGGGVELPAED